MKEISKPYVSDQLCFVFTRNQKTDKNIEDILFTVRKAMTTELS